MAAKHDSSSIFLRNMKDKDIMRETTFVEDRHASFDDLYTKRSQGKNDARKDFLDDLRKNTNINR